jgi:hypothetical protein
MNIQFPCLATRLFPVQSHRYTLAGDAPPYSHGATPRLITRFGFIFPITCISQRLQSKRSVIFSLPLTSTSGSGRSPFTSLGQRLGNPPKK